MNEQTSVGIKFKNSVTGKKKLEEYAKTLSQINTILSGIDKGASKEVDGIAKASKKVTKKDSKNVKNLGKNIDLAFNVGKLLAIKRVMQGLVTTLASLTNRASDYGENYNLFDVAFNNATESGQKLVNTLSDMYGLDESGLMKSIGLYKQLANAMGFAEETGTQLATLMNQMAIDISSLYNIDLDRAGSVLQSAISGLINKCLARLKLI